MCSPSPFLKFSMYETSLCARSRALSNVSAPRAPSPIPPSPFPPGKTRFQARNIEAAQPA